MISSPTIAAPISAKYTPLAALIRSLALDFFRAERGVHLYTTVGQLIERFH